MSKLPAPLNALPFPVIGSPLFIISNPKLVIAQCIAGVVGSMPALNARPAELLEDWLKEITDTLAAYNMANPDKPAAPFAVNQIVHKSNDRLDHDMALCVKYKVPIIITSLGAREDINAAAHSYGGVVLHDIINNRHARKAIEKGADGLIDSKKFLKRRQRVHPAPYPGRSAPAHHRLSPVHHQQPQTGH